MFGVIRQSHPRVTSCGKIAVTNLDELIATSLLGVISFFLGNWKITLQTSKYTILVRLTDVVYFI